MLAHRLMVYQHTHENPSRNLSLIRPCSGPVPPGTLSITTRRQGVVPSASDLGANSLRA